MGKRYIRVEVKVVGKATYCVKEYLDNEMQIGVYTSVRMSKCFCMARQVEAVVTVTRKVFGI